MNDNQPKRIPNLPENPWLTRGTAHILKANKPVPPPQSAPIQSISSGKSTFKEYSIQSKDFLPKLSIEDSLSAVASFIDSLRDKTTNVYEKNGETTDFSVFDEVETVGFINEGNNCYQNCVIQCLLHFPPFYALLSKITELLANNENPYTPILTLLCRIIAVMKQAKADKKQMNLPCRVNLQELRDLIAIKNVMFAEEQSDVQEFFLFFIEEVSKEIESLASSPSLIHHEDEDEDGEWEEVGTQGKKLVIRESVMQQSLINHMFEIQLRKQIKTNSKRQHIEQQSYMTLSLPISGNGIDSVDDALSLYLSGSYGKYNGYRIEQTPSCLIIHLMRFYYDRKEQKPKKINKRVEFSSHLSLEDFDYFETAKYLNYELFGVICHKGNYVTNGHYTCYCKTTNDDEGWICCNDDVIRPVHFAEVLHVEPYMLLYRAVDLSF